MKRITRSTSVAAKKQKENEKVAGTGEVDNPLDEVKKCVVCFDDPLEAPIMNCCAQQHVLCCNCWHEIRNSRNPSCPQCRGSLPPRESRNVLLEKLLNFHLGIFQCPKGCGAAFFYNDMMPHYIVCPLKKRPCPDPLCNAMVADNELVAHFESCHEAIVVNGKRSYAVEVSAFMDSIRLQRDLFSNMSAIDLALMTPFTKTMRRIRELEDPDGDFVGLYDRPWRLEYKCGLNFRFHVEGETVCLKVFFTQQRGGKRGGQCFLRYYAHTLSEKAVDMQVDFSMHDPRPHPTYRGWLKHSSIYVTCPIRAHSRRDVSKFLSMKLIGNKDHFEEMAKSYRGKIIITIHKPDA